MAATQTRTLHGHEVAFREEGPADAQTIVLIHGMAGSSTSWRESMPGLAERYHVIAPDLLGHGRSAKPSGDYSLGNHASLIRDLMVNLDVERATIVGQSLGGGVAMQFTYQYPEFAERLVLVSSGGLGRDVSPLLRLLSLPGAELVLWLAVPGFVRDRGNAVSDVLRRNGIKPPKTAEMWAAYASLAEPENRHAFLRTLRSVVNARGQSVSARDRLYLAAAMPALIIWGDADPIIPFRHGVEAAEVMPGSRLEIFEGVGHFPHMEVPAEFVATVLDFMETTEGAKIDHESRKALLRGDPI